MPIMYVYLYGIVTVVLLAALSYMLGRIAHQLDDGDLIFNVFVGGFTILFWPVVLAIAIVVGPFLGPYYLGKRHHKVKIEKEKMWQTLKK